MNTDTWCLGKNFITLAFTNRTAGFYPYETSYEMINDVPIVSGTTSYDHNGGNTYILIFHEIIHCVKKLPHRFINPNKLHRFGAGVWKNPHETYHYPSIEANDTTTKPLNYQGTNLPLKSIVSTKTELLLWFNMHMTSYNLWEPS